MKQLLVALCCFASLQNLTAQFTIRIVVNEVGAKKQDEIYVAGTFNNWNPKDEKYKLKLFGLSRRAIILKDMPVGKYEFKFTRGSFDKVETTAKGEDVPNHAIDVKEDVALNFDIAGWKDDFPDKPRPNTATAQVKVIDTAFLIPQLNRKRRIWAYLPKSYATGTKKYPVIYMQDGQNLFNEQTAPFGEWGVDETVDSIITHGGKEAIIIGIDHGGDKRMNEYNPFDFKTYGKGEGSQYVDFIVMTLKPYIDRNFRTIKDSAHTFVAGSSMGGLISLYAVAKYPRVFGGAGVFSPAFWTAPAIYDEVSKANFGGFKKFFFYAGGKESDTMVPDMDRMISIIEKKGNYETRRIMYSLGTHNESTWRKEFGNFYQFIIR